jgi:hypothetical protein
MPWQIAVTLRVGYQNLTAGIECLTDYVVVVALEIKPEFDQEELSRQPDVLASSDPADTRGVGSPDLLPQEQLREIIALPKQNRELVEAGSMAVQLVLQGRASWKMGQQQVRGGNCCSERFPVESFECLDRFRKGPGPVVYAGNEVAVEVDELE